MVKGRLYDKNGQRNVGYMRCWLIKFLIIITVSAGANDLRFSHLTIDDGFSENMCQDVVVDSKGYLWKAGFYFLDKYNGYEFASFKVGDKNIGFIGNSIHGLFLDRNDNLWVSTDKGILKYSYEKENFVHYYFENPANILTDDDQGRIWVVSSNQMIRIDPGYVIPVEIIDSNLNWCFSIHNIGKELWMARDHDILIMNTEDHSKDSITPLGENYEYYNNLSLDNRGDLWSFDTGNLYWINSLTKKHRKLPLPMQMPESICNRGRMLFKGDSDNSHL